MSCTVVGERVDLWLQVISRKTSAVHARVARIPHFWNLSQPSEPVRVFHQYRLLLTLPQPNRAICHHRRSAAFAVFPR
jgi:hypothetical protein